MYKCPKCQMESSWGDWDYHTGKSCGTEIPSLGFDTSDFDYKCPECDEWSDRKEIESISK